VVGAAAYALRLFISSMHNRLGPRATSRELVMAEAAAIAPLVLVILAMAFYPQFVLTRTEPTVKSSVAAVSNPYGPVRVASR
jgi:NADH:ubiquinone oxidoreductase subunit 4 (subunit M)